MKPLDDLTQDWPKDPDNDHLVQLAQELQTAAPALSTEALARVHLTIQERLNQSQTPVQRHPVLFRWSLAAAILIALSVTVYWRVREAPAPIARIEPPFIEDTVMIGVAATEPPSGPDQPLIRLDDYRSLYSD